MRRAWHGTRSPAPRVSPAPWALLATPGVDDLLARFLYRRKERTIEAYRKDVDHFAAWFGLPRREAVTGSWPATSAMPTV